MQTQRLIIGEWSAALADAVYQLTRLIANRKALQ